MFKQKGVILGAVLLCSLLSGCAGALIAGGAAAGAGTYAYINGELGTQEEVPIDRVWRATQETVKALQLRIVNSNSDALTGRMHVRGNDGKDIYINMKSLSDRQTQVRIRVGMFGDETLSNLIIRDIEKRL